jgi:hypothetical protein
MPIPKYKCPQCLSTDTLEVVVEVFAKVNQSDTDNIETDIDEAHDSSHDWDQLSVMLCTNCQCRNVSSYFENDRTAIQSFRIALTYYGIAAPQSDEELMSREYSYLRKLARAVERNK